MSGGLTVARYPQTNKRAITNVLHLSELYIINQYYTEPLLVIGSTKRLFSFSGRSS